MSAVQFSEPSSRFGGAENQVSGVFVNVIPKSGGNSVKGILFANYAPGNLQSQNLTDDLQRNAAALNKDVVAMPGRNVRFVVKLGI